MGEFIKQFFRCVEKIQVLFYFKPFTTLTAHSLTLLKPSEIFNVVSDICATGSQKEEVT